MCGLTKHPCCYCTAKKNKLSEGGELRTLQSIKENYYRFLSDGHGDLKKAKDFYNCVNLPLIAGRDNQTILELLPPPELHLFLGVTNYLLENLAKKWSGLYEWLEKNLSVKAVDYHGKSFEACSIFQRGFQEGCLLHIFVFVAHLDVCSIHILELNAK